MDTKLRLKEWRESRGFSQRELARNAGLALSTINELETGKREPNWKTMRKLGAAFDTPPAALEYAPETVGAEATIALDGLRLLAYGVPHEGRVSAARVAKHLERLGIVPEYRDELGHQIRVALDFLRALADVLGVPMESMALEREAAAAECRKDLGDDA
jgi:transcriptional regulator with XRE-family HTH domain